MTEFSFEADPNWQEVVNHISRIREEEDYTPANVDFIRQELQSSDDRVRGAAALAAAGCIFEPYVLDLILNLVEYDDNPAIRKAAIQSLGSVIQEGMEQGLEDQSGVDTRLDEAEEWEEYQTGSLREDYQRVKNLLFNLMEWEDDPDVQELAVKSLADLGYLSAVREKTTELLGSDRPASRLAALKVIGKYPHFWEDELAELIKPDTPVEVLTEAISAAYSSESAQIARAIEGVLDHSDPEVLRYALLTLANINRSENLATILQRFSLHHDPLVQEAAREGIELFTRQTFDDYLRGDLGMSD